MSMTYVIIGCSAAGTNAAAAIRESDPGGEILLLTREQEAHYSRPLLSYYVAGELDDEQILYRGRRYLQELCAELRTGITATGLHLAQRKVLVSSGPAVPYDRLLVACGGSARQPEIPGIDLQGIFHFRTLSDARAVREWSARARVCVTLGGGLVSLKAAEALVKRGVREVVLVVGSDRIMSQALDLGGAEVLRRRLAGHGVRARTGSSVQAILGDARGCVRGVCLEGGEELACEMVIVGKGVRPDLSLVAGTEIATDWGILVDERMRTSARHVYAAGDVAQARDLVHGEARVNALWPLAAQQGQVAGSNMAGRDVTYPGWFAMNALQVFGLPVISMGQVNVEPGGELQVLTHVDERREVYRKLVLRQGRLVGCAVVGDSDGSCLAGLMRQGVDVSPFAEELQLGRGPDYRAVLAAMQP